MVKNITFGVCYLACYDSQTAVLTAVDYEPGTWYSMPGRRPVSMLNTFYAKLSYPAEDAPGSRTQTTEGRHGMGS